MWPLTVSADWCGPNRPPLLRRFRHGLAIINRRLLRPKALLEAQQRYESQRISKEELRLVEDLEDHIREVIKKQDAIGLHSITGGE